MEIFNSQISLYNGTKDNVGIGTGTVAEVLVKIQTGKYQPHISYLRSLQTKQYREEKTKLVAITFSGIFSPKRSKTTLQKWSGFFLFDIDHIDESQIELVKQQLCHDPHTTFCFISPSGKGLKAAFYIKSISNDEDFKKAFNAVAFYILSHYNIEIDRSRKNIDGLCFVSWDPVLYKNPSPIEFDIQIWNEKFLHKENIATNTAEDKSFKSDTNDAFEQENHDLKNSTQYALGKNETDNINANKNNKNNSLQEAIVQHKSDTNDAFVQRKNRKSDMNVAFEERKIPKLNTNKASKINRLRSIWKKNAIDQCLRILQNSSDGNRHDARLRAGELAGGYIAGGILEDNEILPLLMEISDSIADQNKTSETEQKTLKQAIEHGKLRPISESMKQDEYDRWCIQNGFSPIISPELFHNKSITIVRNPDVVPLKHISDDGINILSSLDSHPVWINEETGEIYEDNCFWVVKEFTKRDKITYTLVISHYALLRFLERYGFCRLEIDNLQSIFIRVWNNIAEETSPARMQDFVRSYVEHLPERITNTGDFTKNDLLELLMKPNNGLFTESYVTKLQRKKIQFHSDTADSSFIYFQNCYIRITKDGFTVHDYSELQSTIWRKWIVQIRTPNGETLERTFDKERANLTVRDSDFVKFVTNINDNNAERIISYLTAYGYLLHRYKDRSQAKAVVLADENITDFPEGRTGKGLTLQAVSQYRNVLKQDGKTFDFKNTFAFQRVTLDTDVFFLDDVKKRFDFEMLFSTITEDFHVEKKNKQSFAIPFERSPKIAIATNYTIDNAGDSAKARLAEFVLKKYYSASFQPTDEFQKMFFSHQWNEDDWLAFDLFTFQAVKTYFISEAKLKIVKNESLEIRRLMDQTSEEFITFADSYFEKEQTYNKLIPKAYIFEEFLESSEKYKRMAEKDIFKSNMFSRWLKLYCEFNSIQIVSEKKIWVDQKSHNALSFRKGESSR